MQPQPVEGDTPPNVLQFGRAREPFAPSSDQTAREPGLEIHEHELVRRIGRGAYGEVWLARNALGTMRAIKIVYRKDFEDSRPFEREFAGIQKFEPISRSHPGLVNILQIGRREDYFYYVMELADAAEDPKSEIRSPKEGRNPKSESTAPSEVTPRSALPSASARDLRGSDLYRPHTLREDLRQNGRLPAERCVEIGLALASALAHLHRQGLVHRDVKPSNIIFVQGAPKLADIGLVTEVGDSRSIVGTEGYLPPEGPGTPQADIFALGKVLYEAATGLDRRAFPDLPPDIRDWPDAKQGFELNETLLKACAKDSAKRYSSAESMLVELQRLREGKSIRRARQVERGWRLVRRGGAGATVVVAAAALIVLASRIQHPSVARYIEKRSTNDLANSYFDLGKTHFQMFRGTNLQFACELFNKAIAADTNFASAYGYLAATYFWSDDSWNPGWIFLPQAKTVALRALALDDGLAEPHLALGWYHAISEWNWSEAEKEDKRAVALNGSSPFCHLCYAELLRVIGRNNEALDQIYQAKSLDPYSRIINVRLIHYLTCARRFKDALTQIDQAIAMEAVGDMSWDRRDLFLALGQVDKAIDAERDGRIAQGDPRDKVEHDVANKRLSMPVEGAKVIWRPELQYYQQNQQNDDGYSKAGCYAQLGDTNAALACLEKLLKEHSTMITFNIMGDWRLDPIRSEPRFHAILRTMHLE